MKTLKGPYTTARNYIVIPAGVVSYLQSESEIAFLIAHEIAHLLLGHLELAIDLSTELKDEPQEAIIRHKTRLHVAKIEPEADIYGAILMFNAGYSPYSAYPALVQAENHYSGFFRKHLFLNTGLIDAFDDGHGSPRKRRLKIEGYFQSSNVKNTYEPLLTLELKEARKELKEYQNK